MNRSELLAQIREQEARVQALAIRLQAKADAELDRARDLREAAGKAGYLGRRIRLWIAHRLERKASARIQTLINQRRIAKQDEAPQGGHRSARRRLDRNSNAGD